MIAMNLLLVGLVAGLVGLKVGLLAAAAMLLVYTLTAGARKRWLTRAPTPVQQRRLDVQS